MTEPRTITISEQAAKTLLQVAQQSFPKHGEAKVLLGQAQMELEAALKDPVNAAL